MNMKCQICFKNEVEDHQIICDSCKWVSKLRGELLAKEQPNYFALIVILAVIFAIIMLNQLY